MVSEKKIHNCDIFVKGAAQCALHNFALFVTLRQTLFATFNYDRFDHETIKLQIDTYMYFLIIEIELSMCLVALKTVWELAYFVVLSNKNTVFSNFMELPLGCTCIYFSHSFFSKT